MNCSEVLDYVSAAVDGELEPERRKDFDAHILRCPSCRSEFETERLTKRFVSGKLARQKAPEELRRSVVAGLSSQRAWSLGGSSVKEFFENLLRRPVLRPVLGLGVVALMVVIGVTLFTGRDAPPPPSNGISSDIVAQAVEHYSSYLDGQAKLQYVSSNHDEIRNYFQDKVNFDVYVPKMQNSVLVGGVLCEHEGTKFLSLVYKMDNKIVYFYTACLKELRAKSRIGLTAKAQSDLEKTGWYFDTTRPECNVAVWKENDEICSVVADIGKEELLALVKE